ncbi:MAG: DUF4337 domain-containing protein, partial [Syntrophales bacterium LBB04]|nr:DUF4337 domain-containing protein [Syntrophales bacterium LBB04]
MYIPAELRPSPAVEGPPTTDTPKSPADRWLNYVAMSTVILAVAATLSTFLGNKFSTKAVLSQTQASDQWAYYQAKGIKSVLY